jgi:DNA modification methylase
MNEGCGRKIVPHLTLATHDREYYECCTIINDEHQGHLWRFNANSFDLMVTDPPYGKRFSPSQKHHGRTEWDDEFASFEVTALLGLARVGSYVFCEWDNLWKYEERAPAFEPGYEFNTKGESEMYPTFTAAPDGAVVNNLPKPKSALVWHKLGGGSQGDTAHEHIRNHEMVLFYPGADHEFKKRPRSVLRHKAPGNNAHPTMKPVSLIEEILGWYNFETVLDPFMGSGTTAIAALKLKKHFLGFEANETYFNRAILRIAEMDEQLASRTNNLPIGAR